MQRQIVDGRARGAAVQRRAAGRGDVNPLHAFPESEYEQRRANARQAMSREGLDCVLISTPENIYYLTGLAACPGPQRLYSAGAGWRAALPRLKIYL